MKRMRGTTKMRTMMKTRMAVLEDDDVDHEDENDGDKGDDNNEESDDDGDNEEDEDDVLQLTAV